MVESVAPSDSRPSPVVPWTAALVVTGLCWAITLREAQRMAGGMRMPGDWMMSMAWMAMPGQSSMDAAVMFLAMWEAMMIAMMLPSAMPLVLLYQRLGISRRALGRAAPSQVVLLAGYFLVWLAFGVVAFVAGFGLSALAMRQEGISRAIPAATGVALIVAGVYQVTPLKRACLRHCRSPLSFFTHGWREGWYATFRLGVHHGAYCAACCWALMLIQLAIGVMNLPLMLAIALVIGIEKSWRYGERFAAAAGVAAIVAGVVITARASSG